MILEEIINIFETAERYGHMVDSPEGIKVIHMSDTLAKQIATELRRV